MMETSANTLVKAYHKKGSVCYTRPGYREARWERAVKVYTINQESKYLLVEGVPAVGASKELIELFALYGEVEEYRLLDDYPAEQFTEVYWIKYRKIQAARFGKRKLDNRSFFGGQLHVCYAPEYESVDDTREKLNERRRMVARKCREYFGTTSTSKPPSASISTFTVSPTFVDTETHKASNPIHPTVSNINHTNFMQQNLPLYLQPPPPPPAIDKSLPRIPSAHATLPVEIQNLSASEVYGNHATQSPTPADTNQSEHRSEQKNDPDNSVTKRQESKKRIVWNKRNADSGSSVSYCYTKEPGAWDPFKEERRKIKSLTQDEDLDATASDIRRKLGQTKEPSHILLGNINEEVACPLQNIQSTHHHYQQQQQHDQTQQHQQQQPSAKKRKNDGRKRI
ncbi:RNA-binding protein 48-like [Hydractinia symbiolongicarpus]|uniref:RNA-binding protein 48-like n=1 Tax=Hydractinia symbiolongicarpus TaxID=13093 RepID=UPI00254F19B9|nr:RNA-binding protein 48-like [Hydractinia symbiolongicarpus]